MTGYDPVADQFYSQHRGGTGNVILVVVENIFGQLRFAVFSCIENAMAWASDNAGEDDNVTFSPYVIDTPEFGNERALQ